MRVNIKDYQLFSKVINSMFPEFELPEVGGFAIDSRKVVPGDIFLPLKGEYTDGHQFIQQAEDAGAILAFIEQPIETSLNMLQVHSTKHFLYELISRYRKMLPYPFIGITGSNGKTTTKDLLCQVLSAEMKIMHTQGNFNSTTGALLSLLEFEETSDMAVIEMGANKPAEIEYICNVIQPNMGLITNIGETHLKNFVTKDEIAKTKSALFTALPPHGTAFINMDDPYIANMSIPCQKIEYSLHSVADYRGKWNSGGKDKILQINNDIIDLSDYPESMSMNSLAVYSIAAEMGMKPHTIISQIESFQVPEGRGEVLHILNFSIINDSYNANLESARSGIRDLASMSTNGRKIAVIGDMLELGKQEQEHHQLLGKFLNEKKIDAVFAYGELTRHTILAMNGTTVFHKFYSKKKSLVADLKKFVQNGDIIYIKGSRGMKMEEIIDGLQT